MPILKDLEEESNDNEEMLQRNISAERQEKQNNDECHQTSKNKFSFGNILKSKTLRKRIVILMLAW